jgi:hypothetical protein
MSRIVLQHDVAERPRLTIYGYNSIGKHLGMVLVSCGPLFLGAGPATAARLTGRTGARGCAPGAPALVASIGHECPRCRAYRSRNRCLCDTGVSVSPCAAMGGPGRVSRWIRWLGRNAHRRDADSSGPVLGLIGLPQNGVRFFRSHEACWLSSDIVPKPRVHRSPHEKEAFNRHPWIGTNLPGAWERLSVLMPHTKSVRHCDAGWAAHRPRLAGPCPPSRGSRHASGGGSPKRSQWAA